MEIVSLSISIHTHTHKRQDKVPVCGVGVFVYVKQVIKHCIRPWLIRFYKYSDQGLNNEPYGH